MKKLSQPVSEGIKKFSEKDKEISNGMKRFSENKKMEISNSIFDKSIKNGMIGLEIHVYLVTGEKLFCQCIASRERGVKENVFICPICTGQPGGKPMAPNKTAVEKAVQIGLMLGCTISREMRWQRKHYDWPDLPKGYQNILSGRHAIPVGINGRFFGIKILSMHLEEDPAAWDPETGRVDYNRSGLPLVEIVSEPDFTTGEEVVAWLGKLLHHLAYLKAADSNAGIKVDVNVSIPRISERVEIKNLNSLESIQLAIEHELARQAREGGTQRETRRFDVATGKTIKMREKESGEDYRFIVDPDLPVLVLDSAFVKRQKDCLPETPDVKLARLIDEYKIDKSHANILTKNIDLVEFFERVSEKIDAKFALHWVTVELLRVLNYNKKKLDEIDIAPEHFITLLELVKFGKITELQAKQILNKFVPKSFKPEAGAGKISDVKELERVIRQVIEKNPKAVEDYHAGGNQAFNFLMGEIMKATEKRADFKVAGEVLRRVLSK